jgi:netrin-G3 ligand
VENKYHSYYFITYNIIAFSKQKVYLTNLAPETTYQIEVAGYTIKGDGARSVTKLAKTLPRLPDSPFVFTQKPPGRPSSVIVGWRTSANNVIGYKIRYGRSQSRLRGRKQKQIKMNEMTLSKLVTTHSFPGLGKKNLS